MSTDVQRFSKGYRGKKSRRTIHHAPTRAVDGPPAPKRNRLAEHEGRTPQPSVPQGPRNSTKAERRNRAVRASLVVKPPTYDAKAAAALRRREAAIKRAFSVIPTALNQGVHAPTVPTATARDTGNRPGFAPSKGEAFAAPALSDLEKLHAEGKIGKSLGVKIYEKIAEGGTYLLPEGAELKAGAEGLSVALRGAAAEGGERVGGSELLGKVLKPVTVSTDEGRAAIEARTAERAAAKEGSGVKAAARKAGERVTRTQSKADAVVARRVAGASTRREAAAAAGVPLKAAKLTAAQTLPVVQGHEQAILHNPGKVAKTTARAIPGLVTVPVGQVAAVGVTAGRAASEGAHALGIPGARGYSDSEILAPIAGLAKEQVEFAHQVARVATADDSKEVQEAVENELGLMLPVMLGLGGKAIADKISKGRIAEAVTKIARQTRAAQHKQEAVRVARAGNRTRREVQDRTRRTRQEAGKAKGSEILPGRTVRSGRVRRRDKPLKIHTGDIANFVQRKSIPLDNPAAALAAVRHEANHLRPLPEGMTMPRSKITTRDVIGYILANPKVLEDKHLAAEVESYRQQARYAREHAADLSPEHSERARFVPTAVSADVPLPGERFPLSIRGQTRADAERGAAAKDVLKREARSDKQKARRLGKKAITRQAKAAAIARELRVRERSEPNWVKRNAAVKAKGDRLANQAATYRRGQDQAAELATRKSHAATEIDPTLEPEFVHEMEDRLRSEGRPIPEWSSTSTARHSPSHGATGARITPFPGKSKFRSGSAEEYGLTQEDLGHWLKESVARPVSRRESYKAMRGFLEDNQYESPAGRTDFRSDEAARIFDDGDLDRDDWVTVPAQLYDRAIDPAEAAAQLKLAMDDDPHGAIPAGRRFRIVRRHAANEFFDQIAGDTILPKVAAINRATSFLLLGTSPAWAAAQLVAELAQGAAAQPKILNPAFVRKAMAAYKAMPDKDRWAFEGWAGITRGEPISPGELHLDARTGDLDAAGDAWGVMNTTPLGRFIKSIPRSLQHLDQFKGGRVRFLVTAAKIDSDLNTHLPLFLRGVRGLRDEIGKASADMKGKPLHEQLSYVAEHPEFAKRYAGYIDDVMGNWTALTRNEQLASRLLIFYPFIRMAARWTFCAFPKRHPIKAAMLLYLGEQNANSLHELLGGDPSYFTDWATVPLHLGDGKTDLLPLSRIAPGTGLATELLGEGSKNLPGLALSSLQPGVATAIIAATGVDPSTGEQKAGRGIAALSQLLNLSPITRLANTELTPKGQKPTAQAIPVVGPALGSTERQDALDKLFTKLEQSNPAARLIAPTTPRKLTYERDLVKLRGILDTTSANSSTARRDLGLREEDKAAGANEATRRKIEHETAKRTTQMGTAYDDAQKSLDKLLHKYGVKADPWTGSVYGIAAFGSKPRTTSSFAGVSSPLTEHTQSGVATFGGVSLGAPEEPPAEVVPAPGRPKEATFGGRYAR